MRVRPVSVIVLAGLGMTLAAYLSLELAFTLRSRLQGMTGSSGMTREMMKSGLYCVYLAADTIARCGIVGMLWAGTLGSLRLGGWARKVMLHVAWLSVAYFVAHEAFYLLCVRPYVFEPAMTKVWGRSYTMKPSLFMLALTIIGVRLGLQALYSGCVVVWFNTAAVRKAFEGVEGTGFEAAG